jgi:hypothetical protein
MVCISSNACEEGQSQARDVVVKAIKHLKQSLNESTHFYALLEA